MLFGAFVGRRLFLLLLVLLAALAWVGLYPIQKFAAVPSQIARACTNGVQAPFHANQTALLRNLAPTTQFRDNLRNDSSYITAWAYAGYNNQFMSIVNMIYLGIFANRIPVIPPFIPNHEISKSTPPFPFGDVYDLNHLRKKLRTPILEWRDVKQLLPPSSKGSPSSIAMMEELGCWSTIAESATGIGHSDEIMHHLGIDVSYTRVPSTTRYSHPGKDGVHVVFSLLAGIMYPENPPLLPNPLTVIQPSPMKHHRRLPDAHLTCLDSVYFATSGTSLWEWRQSWSPVWHKIGRHLRYTPALNHLGREYVRRIFKSAGSLEDIPPFIAIHIRRTDFSERCHSVGNKADTSCFPPLSAYQEHVNDIRSAWVAKSNLTVSHVHVMSDDLSPALWADVKNQGWFGVDHVREQTVKHLGEWYPVILDSVIQSLAVGLVGTAGSTFTMISERRIRDWNGGFGREVSI